MTMTAGVKDFQLYAVLQWHTSYTQFKIKQYMYVTFLPPQKYTIENPGHQLTVHCNLIDAQKCQ